MPHLSPMSWLAAPLLFWFMLTMSAVTTTWNYAPAAPPTSAEAPQTLLPLWTW